MDFPAATFVVMFVLLLTKSTEATQPDVPASNLIPVFNNLIHTVQTTFPRCSHLNYIYDSSSLLLNEMTTNEILVQMDITSKEPSTSVFADLGKTSNGGQEPLKSFTESNYNFKHHQPCSLVFFELESAVLAEADHLNNATFGRRWPERMLPLLPNNVYSTFFVFFTSQVSSDPAGFEAKVNMLMDQTGMMRHSVFVIPESSNQIKVLTGLPKEIPLKVVLTSNGGEISAGKTIFYEQFTNFQGSAITTVSCVVCAVDEKFYREFGMARTGYGVAWFVVQDKFNMTSEVESVFGVPNVGVDLDLDENGDEILSYDEFILPIVEGTAAMSSLVLTTPYILDAILFTRPYIFDYMTFLTAPPKLRNLSSMKVLAEPLENQLWFGFFISFACMVLCMEALFYFRERKPVSLAGLAAILSSTWDQSSPYTSRMKCWAAKLCFGTWLLYLIVMGSAYKSKLISAIVIPHYDYPPRTFKELADSDYYIGAVYVQKIELDFGALNTSVNMELMRRAVEIDFLDPTCYQLIFEHGKACLGYQAVFEKIGLKYMVDVKGRPIFLSSKDTHFSSQGTLAISKFYPMLLEPFDWTMGALDATGISEFLIQTHIARNKQEGRIYAQKNIETLKFYKGLTSDEWTNDDKVIDIAIEVLKLGFSSAMLVFVLEAVCLMVHAIVESFKESTEWRPRNLLPSGRRGIAPHIYESEFYCRGESNFTLIQECSRQYDLLESAWNVVTIKSRLH